MFGRPRPNPFFHIGIRPTTYLIFLFSCPCGHRFVSALSDSSPTTPCPAQPPPGASSPGDEDRSVAQAAAGTEGEPVIVRSQHFVLILGPCLLAQISFIIPCHKAVLSRSGGESHRQDVIRIVRPENMSHDESFPLNPPHR